MSSLMPGPLSTFLEEDHRRLAELLAMAVRDDGSIDTASFDAFRKGLLRHIALEEKILFRAAREAGGDEALPTWRELRIDHGALTSLLVPTPTRELVGEIRSILDGHNVLEEDPGGAYERCDALLAAQAEALLERMRSYPEVKVMTHNDGPGVYRTAKEALAASARQKAVRRPG